MTAFRAFLLGTLAYLAFLLATIPAQLVARQVERQTAGQVKLVGAAGTAWSATARLEIASGNASLAIDEVRWRFLPARLLAGQAAFLVEARASGLDARAEVSRGALAWEARDLSASSDAAIAATLFPLAGAWQPAGSIAVESARLAWDGNGASGEATIEWRDAALALSPVRPLGTWRAKAIAQGATAKVNLETIEGPLQLSGEGSLALPGRLQFAGEARAQPGHERDLEALLDLLGPRRADGARALEMR